MTAIEAEGAPPAPGRKKAAWRERLAKGLGSEGLIESMRQEFKGLPKAERTWRSEILAMAAVERGLKAELMFALEECSPNTTGMHRLSLLHKAAAGGWVELIAALAEAGANLDAREMSGETPICRAAEHGHMNAVMELSRLGASPSLGQNRENHRENRSLRGSAACHGPLHIAAASGQVELARFLATAGADIKAKDDRGLAPIDLALANPAMVDALSKLDPCWHAREARDRLFHRACALGHLESAEILLGIQGADPDVAGVWNTKSALHAASCNGHVECVEMLIRRGVDPNKRDCWGNTPLMEACRGIAGKGALPSIKTLLAAGADASLENKNGENALRILVLVGNSRQKERGVGKLAEGVARMLAALPLVAAGVSLNQADRHGITPALAAAIAGQWAAVKALHELGANVGEERVFVGGIILGFPLDDLRGGCSPALICAARGDLAGMLTLHGLGVDVLAANRLGVDARALAMRFGREDIVGALDAIREQKELGHAAKPAVHAKAWGARL